MLSYQIIAAPAAAGDTPQSVCRLLTHSLTHSVLFLLCLRDRFLSNIAITTPQAPTDMDTSAILEV